MGLRNPSVFGHVISFSSTWIGNHSKPTWIKGQAPSHYLLVGKLESETIQKLVKEWGDTLSKNGVNFTLHQPIGGHDVVMWREWFADALLQEFGARPK